MNEKLAQDIFNFCNQKEINGETYWKIPYTYIKTNKELSQAGGWSMMLDSMIELIEDPYEFKIYCYLCKCWNKDNYKAFPSISQIATACSISEKKVKNSIKSLKEQGAIKVSHNREKSTSQWLHNSYEIFYFERNEKLIYLSQINKLEEDLRKIGKKPIFNEHGCCIGIEDLDLDSYFYEENED